MSINNPIEYSNTGKPIPLEDIIAKLVEESTKDKVKIEQLKELEGKVAGLEGGFKERLESTERGLKEKIENNQLSIIETIGIFVALFTFVSVDIQVFKTEISTLSALGFTLIMLGALLIFVIVLVYLSKGKQNNLLLFFSVILIIFGVCAIGLNYVGVKQVINNDFYTKKEVDNILSSSTMELKIQGSNNKIQTDALKKQIDNLKSCLKSGGWNKCF